MSRSEQPTKTRNPTRWSALIVCVRRIGSHNVNNVVSTTMMERERENMLGVKSS